MSEFRAGDRVLVEGVMGDGEFRIPLTGVWSDPISEHAVPALHPHPGVPVSDLLEELKTLWWAIDKSSTDPRLSATWENHIQNARKFRAARETASKPKFQEGDEVWVRARIRGKRHGIVERPWRVDHPHNDHKSDAVEPTEWFLHSDDIKKADD